MVVLEKSVSIYELLDPAVSQSVSFAEDEEILLAAIVSFLFYECNREDFSLCSVIKVLKSIGYRHGFDAVSTFDCLFGAVKERTVIHPAVVLYDLFAKFPVARKIALRDSCLSKLGLMVKGNN